MQEYIKYDMFLFIFLLGPHLRNKCSAASIRVSVKVRNLCKGITRIRMCL